MSLINQMLQDLDARRAAHGGGTRLPNDVRPLPRASASRWPLIVATGVGLVAVLGLGFVLRDHAMPRLARLLPLGKGVEISVAAKRGGESAPVIEPVVPAVKSGRVAVDAPEALTTSVDPEGNTPIAGLDVSLRMADFIDAPVEPPDRPGRPPVSAEPQVPQGTIEKPAAREDKLPAPKQVPAPASRPADVAKAALPAKSTVDGSDVAVEGKPSTAPVIERTPAVRTPRERAESAYGKAIAAANLGRVAEATEGLREALHQDTFHVAARQLLVKLLLEAKRGDEAIQVLREGIAEQPAQIAWAMSLARLQVDQGALADAWQTLDHSLPAAGASPDYLGFAANILQRLGRYDDAAAHYRKAARLSPADGRWWLGLGWCLDAQGNTAEARDAFQRARQSGSLSPELLSLIEQKLH